VAARTSSAPRIDNAPRRGSGSRATGISTFYPLLYRAAGLLWYAVISDFVVRATGVCCNSLASDAMVRERCGDCTCVEMVIILALESSLLVALNSFRAHRF
jgi:hypothetical protein